MANYKPYGRSSVGSNYYQATVPKNTVISLYYDVNILSTVQTMRKQGGVSYQVPTGKKFTITSIIIYSTAVANKVTCYQADTVDAQTTFIITVRNAAIAGEWSYPCNIEIVAGKYITFKPTTTNITYIAMVGFEEEV